MARTDTPWTEGNDDTYIQTIKDTGYNVLINGLNKYLNFNSLVGSSGYGFRDNSGVMEFKNSAGAWAAFGSGDLTKALADTYYYPLSTNPNGYLTADPFWSLSGSTLSPTGTYEVDLGTYSLSLGTLRGVLPGVSYFKVVTLDTGLVSHYVPINWSGYSDDVALMHDDGSNSGAVDNAYFRKTQGQYDMETFINMFSGNAGMAFLTRNNTNGKYFQIDTTYYNKVDTNLDFAAGNIYQNTYQVIDTNTIGGYIPLDLWQTDGTTLTPRGAETGISLSGTGTFTSIIKTGGTSSQFLKADGSVDSSTYITGSYLPIGGGTLTGDLTLSTHNLITDTTTGTKIGTATNQKLGFFNATPVVQRTATTDLGVVLSNLGLRAVGTAYPITTTADVKIGTDTVWFKHLAGYSNSNAGFTQVIIPGSNNSGDSVYTGLIVGATASPNGYAAVEIHYPDDNYDALNIYNHQVSTTRPSMTYYIDYAGTLQQRVPFGGMTFQANGNSGTKATLIDMGGNWYGDQPSGDYISFSTPGASNSFTRAWTILKSGNLVSGINGTGTQAITTAGLATLGNIIDSGLTASKPVFTNASKQLVSGLAVPQIVASNNLLAQTATVSSVTTYTTPNDATVHSFRIGAYAAVINISAGTLTITVTFREENNGATTVTYFPMGLTTAGLTTTGYTAFAPINIRAYPNTAITLVATFAGVSTTFDVGGTIESLY